MKKKIGAIVMAGVMACTMTAGLAFAGCGSKVKADFVMPSDGFDTSKNVEITFYHTMGQNNRPILQNHIEKFNELYPNIKITEEAIGGYDDVRNQINTEIMAGDQPNLAYCYPDHVALFNQAGAVQSLNVFLADSEFKDMKVTRADGSTEYICLTQEQTDAFIPGYYAEGFQFDDGTQMYTLPFSKSTEVLYYNKTFFEDNNLTVPKTWDEMEQVCAKIKELKPDAIPFGYDSESNWFITMCEQLGTPYTSAEGEKYLFDTPENRAFVERFKGWKDKGYFTTQTLNNNKYTSNLFTAQTSYMSIGSSAGAKNQAPKRVDGKYPFEVGITSIPQSSTDEKDFKVISQGPSVCIFKQDDPQEVLASWLFVKYLTTSVDFQAQFSDASGYVPVISTVLENEIYKKYLKEADGYDHVTYLAASVCMEQANYYYTSPAFVGSSNARDMVGNIMSSVFAGTATIDEAFKYAIEQCKYFVG